MWLAGVNKKKLDKNITKRFCFLDKPCSQLKQQINLTEEQI
jgi:hypothetical protein